ncbi:hypothetical protein MAP00_001496 [Monascus purpureus]|nr:hypothetical protein MAP00_001496 [Monascus purpureus]
MSTALVMLGYDTSLLSTLYAYPSFQKKFGEKTGDDGYQVPARWQALSNSATAGVILGLICVSWLVDQYGSVSLASYVLIVALIFIPLFAPNRMCPCFLSCLFSFCTH